MCIAVLQKQNSETINKSILKRCFESNHNGASFTFCINKELHTMKFFKFKKFWKKYRDYHSYYGKLSNFMLHFRFATHGKVDLDNCHPFYINDNLAFVHNGILDIKIRDQSKSDTWHFCEILKEMPNNFLYSPSIMEFINKFAGINKLIFLDSNNNYTIINENLGTWDNDIWYSNTGYKEYKYHYARGEYDLFSKYEPGFTSNYTSKFGNKLTYHKEDKTVFCDYCGKKIIEDKHKETGLCRECTEKYFPEYLLDEKESINWSEYD